MGEERRPVARTKRPLKPKAVNPIEKAVRNWLQTLPESLSAQIQGQFPSLVADTPRRWVVYPPMVLIPSGSFAGETWTGKWLSTVGKRSWEKLWREILDCIGEKEGKGTLTHLAVNAGIPLNKNKATEGKETSEEENILRSPSGLLMLYGDFGPAIGPSYQPTERDFNEAFWVSTKQNGIVQVWAPRHTMFSRGNVKEKARLLEFHSLATIANFESRVVGREQLGKEMAVDLYAGIGYFVFSYTKLGIGKVAGWELNPWSVEGLRRGAAANGWSVKVVRPGDEFVSGDEQIVVFLEDNARAEERLNGIDWKGFGKVRHINCGLLPTSEGSWEMTLRILKGDGWLHLHQNVGVSDITKRTVEIEEIIRGWITQAKEEQSATVEHVEKVKTFAPGVWHCVFDVYINLT